MSTYHIIVLAEAISEITDSCAYYNEQSPGLGKKFEDEVFRLIEIIKDNPLLFPVKFAHFHEAVLTHFPFLIIYEVYGEQIIVSAVFHTKRHPDKKVKRRHE